MQTLFHLPLFPIFFLLPSCTIDRPIISSFFRPITRLGRSDFARQFDLEFRGENWRIAKRREEKVGGGETQRTKEAKSSPRTVTYPGRRTDHARFRSLSTMALAEERMIPGTGNGLCAGLANGERAKKK